MSMNLLEVHGLEKRFDGINALDGFSCSLRYGEVLGLLGPNGAGKTTLFNVISGLMAPDSGKTLLRGRDITGSHPQRIANAGVSRTFQNLRLIRQVNVLDNVMLSFKNQSGEKLRNVFFRWRKCRAQETVFAEEARALLQGVGLVSMAKELADNLSYGQQKLLSIVCCLATKSDVLLLDEPVAGIAPEMTERILETIRGLPSKGKSVILIEHNLDAVMQICNRVIFMDAGVKVSEGSPQEIRNDPRVIEAYIH